MDVPEDVQQRPNARHSLKQLWAALMFVCAGSAIKDAVRRAVGYENVCVSRYLGIMQRPSPRV